MWRVCLSAFHRSLTVNATRVPSGENCGSCTVRNSRNVSALSGFACVDAGADSWARARNVFAAHKTANVAHRAATKLRMNCHLASRDLGFQGNIIHVKPAKRTKIWVEAASARGLALCARFGLFRFGFVLTQIAAQRNTYPDSCTARRP